MMARDPVATEGHVVLHIGARIVEKCFKRDRAPVDAQGTHMSTLTGGVIR